MQVLKVGSGPLSLAQLRGVLAAPVRIEITPEALAAVDAGAAAIAKIVASGDVVYGVNTGFGLLANTQIPPGDLQALQRNLVLSHACGVGALLPDAVVRLIITLKMASLARGASGVRRETLLALKALLDAEVYPCIPGKGSVGASGDLAPLAHMSAVLIGVGEARVNGRGRLGARGSETCRSRTPRRSAPKEGLALLNGTQVSTALALAGLFATEAVFAAAIVAGAMSTEALKGSDTPFDPRIHALRGQPGQIDVAARLKALMTGSAIRESHREDDDASRTPIPSAASPR